MTMTGASAMSDPRITDEAVEAAAKAIYETPHDGLSRQGYDRAHRDIQDLYRAEATAALGAALPHLAPQPVVDREALIDVLRGFANDPDDPDGDGWVFFADDPGDIADVVLALLNGGAS